MAKAKKFHVHCKLDNASNLINGIEFAEHEDGGVRTVAPVDQDVADAFKQIPGYSIFAASANKSADPNDVAPPATAATGADVKPDGNDGAQVAFL
ncbi:MAG TPA: hypothetical protein DEQ40_08140 [Oxalobacteraceae bacterium]|nr:hypothetical protein [Oxalobacteraceae bacterium]